ncbi:unnamed protein product [Porites lobata]|uniref:Uncharacterized protein n=1 Tax=Porites lobata TaxID=104759 RepID=A0ABN8RDZ3_9CNID|nr:unnamed protein product [Porites lobata]
MAFLQAGRKVVLSVVRQSGLKLLRTAPVALQESRNQNGFHGLENCFVWDDKHGFGYNKDGEVVIVKPDIEVPSQMFSSSTAGSYDYQIETKSFSQTYMPDMKEVKEFPPQLLQDDFLYSDSDDENFPACAGSKF